MRTSTGQAGREARGARLRALRKARGLTQEVLAESAGMLRTHVVKIETGRSPVTNIDVLRALAGALPMPLGKLIAELDEAEAAGTKLENHDAPQLGSRSAKGKGDRARSGKAPRVQPGAT